MISSIMSYAEIKWAPINQDKSRRENIRHNKFKWNNDKLKLFWINQMRNNIKQYDIIQRNELKYTKINYNEDNVKE